MIHGKCINASHFSTCFNSLIRQGFPGPKSVTIRYWKRRRGKEVTDMGNVFQNRRVCYNKHRSSFLRSEHEIQRTTDRDNGKCFYVHPCLSVAAII